MHALAAADRPEFAPPPQRGTTRAVILALIAHALLIAALTWGVRWKRDAEDDAVEAELWSTTVQQAAPRAVAPPPAPVPRPAPPPPPPPPPPPRAVQPPPAPPVPKQPDINLEREKKLKEQKERERELEEARQEKLKQQAAKKAQEKKELEAKQRAEEEAERKKEQQQKLAEQKKKQEAEAKKAEAAKAEAAKQTAEKIRQDNIRRSLAQAGSNDETSAPRSGKGAGSGNSLSAGYLGRVAALVKRNLVFPSPELVPGNPAVDIEVATSPDGTIVSSRIVKSSGVSAWDEAALRAIQRTDVMPRDTDGRVPSPFPPIRLRPKDLQ